MMIPAGRSGIDVSNGPGSESSDLAPEALIFLRPQENVPRKDLGRAIRSSRFREFRGIDEERLRFEALNGGIYAMGQLGALLISEDETDSSYLEGLQWLRKSADLGNPFAMERLGDHELDRSSSTEAMEIGEKWLLAAATRGSRTAIVNLGARLMTGNGLVRDARRGELLLRKAGKLGNQMAIIRLGVFLIEGFGLDADPEGGLRLLRQAGATNTGKIIEFGLRLYQISRAASSFQAARSAAHQAGRLFWVARCAGAADAGINLAYLIRRGEVGDGDYPSLDELLERPLQLGDPFAFTNEALRLAKGVQCGEDWEKGDAVFQKIEDSASVADWWIARSLEGDPEGHLVIGWLVRHGLSTDPEASEIAERMNFARRGGWRVPDWMTLPRWNVSRVIVSSFS